MRGSPLLGAWYWWFRRANRRRSIQILGWIEDAFSGHGSVSSARWYGASCFRVDLLLRSAVFRKASLAVELEPREFPLNWLLNRLRKRKETVTFQAELEHRPSRNLQIQKQYWCGQTRQTKPAPKPGWHLVSLKPVLMTTQPNWQNGSGHMLETLQTFARTCDFCHVAFRKQAPEFVVTAPLQSLSPDAQALGMADVLRDLASIASTSTY